MKATVTISRRGMITLPPELRSALQLKADDQLIAELTSDGLLLRPPVTLPLEIYTAARIVEFDASEAELAALLKKKTSGGKRARRSPRTATR